MDVVWSVDDSSGGGGGDDDVAGVFRFKFKLNPETIGEYVVGPNCPIKPLAAAIFLYPQYMLWWFEK